MAMRNHPAEIAVHPRTPQLIMAALSALTLAPVHAQALPERATLWFKAMAYQDSQPNADRIKVDASAISLSVPLAGAWLFDGSVVVDAISGASPAFHTVQRSFSNITDTRRAIDLGVTRYVPDAAVKVGVAASDESDYRSRALSSVVSFYSEDRNTTVKLGVGVTKDSISSNVAPNLQEERTTVDWVAGVTQVLTPNDIAQFSTTAGNGQGFFSDPYKVLDSRPRVRLANTISARWNHHFAASETTSRLSYRYYTDTNGIRSHTLGVEVAFISAATWTVTPLVRAYTQTAAKFYVDPNPRFPTRVNIPQDYVPGESLLSFDQRQSAFGALTLGLKVSKSIGPDWALDMKYERYEQRSEWALRGSGSPGLLPFYAKTVQLGLTRQF